MWFFYSLFFAIWGSFVAIIVKRFSTKIEPKLLLFSLNIFVIISMFFLLMIMGGFPNTTISFFRYMLISAILDVFAFLSFFAAVKISPISLLAPLGSFGPVFTAIIASFTIGEIPNSFGLLGILLTVVGAYFLHIGDIKQGILKPFESLIKFKGARIYMIAPLLWSITPIFQKKAIFETNPTTPLFASFAGIVFITLFISPFAVRSIGKIRSFVKGDFKILFIFGIFEALSQLAAYTAFSQAQVGYVTAILRMSSLFTIILGGKLLKETRIRERLVGASIMISGALLLALKA